MANILTGLGPPGGESSSVGDMLNPVRLASNLAVGAYHDPIIGMVTRQTLGNMARIWGEGPQDVDNFMKNWESRLGDSRFADVTRLVGQLAPAFYAGTKVLGWTEGLVENILGRAAPKLAERAGGGWLADQGINTKLYLENRAGMNAVAKPVLVRGAEIAGNALGGGALSGVYSAADPEDDPSRVHAALRGFAVGTAVTAGFEGAITGAGKLISRRAREIDPLGAVQNYLDGKGPAQFTKEDQRLAKDLQAAREYQVDIDSQVAEFERGGGKAPPKVYEAQREAGRKVAQAEGNVSGLVETLLKTNPALVGYQGTGPIEWTGPAESFQRLALWSIKAPELFTGQMGVTGAKILNNLKNMGADIALSHDANYRKVAGFLSSMRQAMGATGKPFDDKFLEPVIDTYEKQGLAGVRGRWGDSVGNIMEDMVAYKDKVHGEAAKIGAKPAMGPDQLREMLTPGGHWPHMIQFDRSPQAVEERLVNGLMKAGYEEDEAKATAAVYMSQDRYGPASFGSFDKDRVIPGTLADKRGAGMPYMGPTGSLLEYLNRGSYRTAVGRFFGYDGALAFGSKGEDGPLLRIAAAEGANVHIMRDILNSVIGRKYYDWSLQRISQNITSLEAALKLPFVVIPHSTQMGIAAMTQGVRPVAMAFKDLLSTIGDREGREAMEKAVGLGESIYQSMWRSMGGGLPENYVDKFVQGVLKYNGFTMEMRYNRMLAGQATRHDILDTMARALDGDQLKGNTLNWARRRFEQYGLNLDDLVNRARKAPDGAAIEDMFRPREFERAIYRGAQVSQFMPDFLNRPLGWNSPWGRVFSQFKNFSLRYGLMLRDNIVAEAARGNWEPLSSFMAIAPVSGEWVGSIERSFKERDNKPPQDGVARYLEDISYVGGMGMATQMMTAAYHKKLLEWAAGPFASDVTGMSNAVARGVQQRSAKPLYSFIVHQPIAQAAYHLHNHVEATIKDLRDYASTVGKGSSGSATLDSLRRQSQ